jgi:hypothetical protein
MRPLDSAQEETGVYTSRIALALLICWVLALPLAAQTTTGTITGAVLDPQGAVVTDAKVTARNIAQNTVTSTTTDRDGKFVFTNLLPSTYEITVTKQGFATHELANVVLNANTSISVPNITLKVAGAKAETVEVVAQGDQIQTETAQRNTIITSTQLANIQNNGRGVLGYLRLVPGVYSDLNTQQASNSTGNIYVNGGRAGTANITINGASDVDAGSNNRLLTTVNPDNIQEFAAITNSYEAQYGKSSGGQINFVTKSGTTSFHGMVYEYFRDRNLNANTWDNKRRLSWLPARENATAAQQAQIDSYAWGNRQYHYTTTGYNIGGPLYIPGKFNKDKSKLFFFWSDEYQHQVFPNGAQNVMMPTALERAGDFSQSIGQDGTSAKYIKDPLVAGNCKASDTTACFQGLKNGVPTVGVIPANRIFAPGQALLNFLPLPNNLGQSNTYNYTSGLPNSNPRHEQLARIDYNINSKWRLNGSWSGLPQDGVVSPYNPSGYSYATNFPINGGAGIYDHPGNLFTTNLTTTINDKTVNEFIFNYNNHPVAVMPTDPSKVTVAGTGVNLPVLSSVPIPGGQPWIPAFTFNGGPIANSPNINPGGINGGGGGSWTPFMGYNTILELADNFSRMEGKHFLKFGLYMNRNRKNQPAFNYPSGFYNFGNGNSNPYDTGNGFANALIGSYRQYNQSTSYINGTYRFTNFEWYGQDTWRVNRRLTLNGGLRVYYVQPIYDQNANLSNFLPSMWQLSQAGHSFKPGVGSNVLIDSVTGSDVTATCAGLFPALTAAQAFSVCNGKLIPGIGSNMNGIIRPGSLLPDQTNQNLYVVKAPGLLFAPRLGLTFDVTGKGNIVFRMGGGMFPDRYQGNNIFNLITNPPETVNVNLYNGMAQSIQTAQGISAAPTIQAMQYDSRVPVVYNWNAGIQARLPKAFTADIAYVGGTSRHLVNAYNLNAVPFGAMFLQQNQDPSKTANGIPGHTAYSATLIRPYQGWDTINVLNFAGTSNYNSLQAQLNRRFANGLYLSASYVWQRCFDTQDGDGGGDPVFPTPAMQRAYSYGPCGFDIRQNFTASYVYPLPKFSKWMGSNNGVLTRIVDGWLISGVTNFRNGTPATVNMGVNGIDGTYNYTGTTQIGTLRAVLVGDPYAGTSSDPYHRLNAAAYTPQPVATLNNGVWTANTYGFGQGRNQIIQPGVNNFDLTLQKNVQIKEAKELQLRLEAFNAFNHTQFAGLNTTINYTAYGVNTQQSSNVPLNANGTINTGAFGAVSGARGNRVVQLTAKFVF